MVKSPSVHEVLDSENSSIPIVIDNNYLNNHEFESQLKKLENRKIWLPCGGFITIDKTAEPACAAPAAEPTPAEEKKVSEKVEPTPAPAVTEEKAEAEEDDSEIEDNLIPEADPAAVSKNFYNPSNSIVLR